ncbi:MAG: DUF445 family protein [Clostridium sp.]|uniref:DUF445 family protein n=1 Tax=Clostridium sp. TaxID=1506 RepID=UPI003D6D640C
MRNKKIADLSIVGLTILVIIITFIKINFRNSAWVEFLSFVIEAALVGSIADWFAITALFKEPFLVGKIPIVASHTAIISKNREIIVDSLANMVQNELLSEKVLRSKIEEINITDRLIGFVEKNVSTRSDLYEKLVDYFIEKIDSVDSLEFAEFLEKHIKQKIGIIDVSVYLDKGISYGLESDEFKEVFNIIIDSVIEYVNRDGTKKILQKIVNDVLKKEANSLVMEKIIGILKSVKAISTSDITISILKQSNKLLLNLKNEDDIVRLEIIKQIKQIFKKVNLDDKAKGDIEEWKMEIIKEISLKDYFNEIIKEVLKIITDKELYLSNNPIEKCNKFEINILNMQDIVSIVNVIKIQLGNSWNDLKTDDAHKKNIDGLIKESVFRFIGSKYQNVGYIVKQVLNNMNDESLNDFINQKAGNNLHAIRINGCVVGALFGGFVFVVTHLIYNWILPNIFNVNF